MREYTHGNENYSHLCLATESGSQELGGTYPAGLSAPAPNKNCSICRARYWRAR
jgi:hypothetical protein